jgi:hypothetical protein
MTTEINIELSRLIAVQTAFYQKANPTPAELQEFEQRAGAYANCLMSWQKRRQHELSDRTRSK